MHCGIVQFRMNDSRRDLANRLMDGRLAEFLRDARQARDSYFTISVRLRDEHGISVNPASVRRWAIDMGVHEPAADEPTAATA